MLHHGALLLTVPLGVQLFEAEADLAHCGHSDVLKIRIDSFDFI